MSLCAVIRHGRILCQGILYLCILLLKQCIRHEKRERIYKLEGKNGVRSSHSRPPRPSRVGAAGCVHQKVTFEARARGFLSVGPRSQNLG